MPSRIGEGAKLALLQQRVEDNAFHLDEICSPKAQIFGGVAHRLANALRTTRSTWSGAS
jgi:hypothetical protein